MMTEVELERTLRDLYRSEDPPPGLAASLRARARSQQPGRLSMRRLPWVGACVLLLAACAFVAIGTWRRRHAAQQAQAAQAQLQYALGITAGELNWAETRVVRDLHAGQKGAMQ